jgi:hypothetical protein
MKSCRVLANKQGGVNLKPEALRIETLQRKLVTLNIQQYEYMLWKRIVGFFEENKGTKEIARNFSNRRIFKSIYLTVINKGPSLYA